jgi:hypothetical protein
MRSLIIVLVLVFISGCAAVTPPAVIPMRDQGNIAQLTTDEGTCEALFPSHTRRAIG